MKMKIEVVMYMMEANSELHSGWRAIAYHWKIAITGIKEREESDKGTYKPRKLNNM